MIIINEADNLYIPKNVAKIGTLNITFRNTSSNRNMVVTAEDIGTSSLYYKVSTFDLPEGEYEYVAKIDGEVVDKGMAVVKPADKVEKIYDVENKYAIYDRAE